MKKCLIVSLMLLSLLTLAACGTTQGDTTDSTDSSQTAADATHDAQDTAPNDAQDDTQKNAQNDTQEGSKDGSRIDGKIKPLPDELDLNRRRLVRRQLPQGGGRPAATVLYRLQL